MSFASRAVPTSVPFESPVRLREVRLVSGLVLGTFLLTHFGNHALGLISVETMEEGRLWFNLLWRNPIGTALLDGSLLLHFGLALQAIYRRRTLRMPFREAAQLGLGLAIPFLLHSARHRHADRVGHHRQGSRIPGRGSRSLGTGSRERRPPSRGSRCGLATWVPRCVLLAPPQAMVHAVCAPPLHRSPARSCPSSAWVCSSWSGDHKDARAVANRARAVSARDPV